MSCCDNPDFTKVNEEYICLNCLFTEPIIKKNQMIIVIIKI